MNESLFLAEFYGPSLTWFGTIFCTMGVLMVLGNALLLWIALSTPTIRSISSYWLIISTSFSDFLFGFATSVLCVISFTCGKNGTCPVLVKFFTGLSSSTIANAIVSPTFILLNRYLSVTTLPNDRGRIRTFLNSNKGVLSMLASEWLYGIIVISILASFDALGEDLYGMYGAKPFTSFWLYLSYMTAGSYGISSYFVTFYFYGKLQKFVKSNMEKGRGNRSIRQQQQLNKENNETRDVMKMVKLSTLLPLLTQSVAFSLDGGQWFIPAEIFPMWFRRVTVLFYAIHPIFSPFIVMLLLGHFKHELKRRFGCFLRSNSVSVTIDIDGPVPRI